MTSFTFFLRNFSFTMTLITFNKAFKVSKYSSLNCFNSSRTTTFSTFFHCTSWFSSISITSTTFSISLIFYCLFYTFCCFFKSNFYLISQVRSFTAESSSESTCSWTTLFKGCMTESIILSSFFFVRYHLICFIYLFKFFFSFFFLFFAGVTEFIRMIFHGSFSVCFLNISFRSIFCYS